MAYDQSLVFVVFLETVAMVTPDLIDFFHNITSFGDSLEKNGLNTYWGEEWHKLPRVKLSKMF